ncbi:MAG: glycosyl hydrolase family 28-related protein [Planctomycetota bacterium]|nr:glycosyl hydrolase family 28-related protein [Planctomycetota bacterium]
MSTRSRRQFASTLTSITTAGLIGSCFPIASSNAQSPLNDGSSLPGVFNVRDFGAKGDGTTKDTLAIQATIDACSKSGGGTVYLPPGVFLSGTITLKDNVTLHLAHTAKLLGRSDYPAKPFPARDLDIGASTYGRWFTPREAKTSVSKDAARLMATYLLECRRGPKCGYRIG